MKADTATSNKAKEHRDKADDQNDLAVMVPSTWGLERPERNGDNIQGFKDRLAKHNRGIVVIADMVDMGESGSTPSNKDRLKRPTDEKGYVSPESTKKIRRVYISDLSCSRKHPGYQAALKFAEDLLNRTMTTKRIRVALLDDGVNPEKDGISKNLASYGFPRSSLHGKDDPWYTSTNGHGTVMASIIASICPFVEIHVAKIDCRKQGYLPNPVFDVRKLPDVGTSSPCQCIFIPSASVKGSVYPILQLTFLSLHPFRPSNGHSTTT